MIFPNMGIDPPPPRANKIIFCAPDGLEKIEWTAHHDMYIYMLCLIK